ncbi:S1C family serine protease [Ilumatobacter sp.]|uniref:S1C family serine protease n=1 Tax=Ilumatobacter sp. TaxID=1967498 RepID=UPI003C60786B
MAQRPSRARFGTGVVLGVALSGAAVGGFVVGTSNDSSAAVSLPSATIIGEPTSATSIASISDLAAAARPSIVAVRQTVTQQGQFGNTQEGDSVGTGFVLSADGYIVTNSHVVADGDETTVDFDDGTTVAATIVASDPSHDLAVLKVDLTGLVPLPVGSSDDLRLGDQLVVIGYALDLTGEPSVTTGILSGMDRSLTEPNGELLVNLLQTDTAINPGNSGGPLLNSRGEVIGINTAVAGQAENIGFAIAISPAQELISELQAGVIPERALLGVTSQPSTEPDILGAEVIDVSANTAASAAGIRTGDIVTAIDDEPVDGPESLGTLIAQRRAGDDITVTVSRDGQLLDISAPLGVRETASQ